MHTYFAVPDIASAELHGLAGVRYLDTVTGAEILRLLGELHAAGHTIVVITHDPSVAARCPRQVEMRDGRVVADRRGAVAS